jgi:hypothetical protein
VPTPTPDFQGVPPGEAYIYPNPVGSEMAFFRFKASFTDPQAELRIYTLAGDLVKEFRTVDLIPDPPVYRFPWDLKNRSGTPVASGVYYFHLHVSDPGNGMSYKAVKRFAVIK